ncbi:hypothetical protein F5Y16DRAFT_424356 [Xylariaceae sp. FL0255]|nr:hypothetical protein F5Y16DRAFT_424356 [Xylariaceae sp. FL0255]
MNLERHNDICAQKIYPMIPELASHVAFTFLQFRQVDKSIRVFEDFFGKKIPVPDEAATVHGFLEDCQRYRVCSLERIPTMDNNMKEILGTVGPQAFAMLVCARAKAAWMKREPHAEAWQHFAIKVVAAYPLTQPDYDSYRHSACYFYIDQFKRNVGIDVATQALSGDHNLQ